MLGIRYLTKTAEKVAALGDVKYMIVTARENADGEQEGTLRQISIQASELLGSCCPSVY